MLSKLLFEKREYFRVDYSDLEKLIRDVYNDENYEIVAQEEWSNDSSYNFTVNKEELDKYSLQMVKERKCFSLPCILIDLANEDLIPEGDYLVQVCW